MMNKITLKIEGMACSMCEAHMNDTVRKAVADAKKVSSSHRKGETVFLSESVIDREKLAEAIRQTGYQLKDISVEPYEKKGLFGLR